MFVRGVSSSLWLPEVEHAVRGASPLPAYAALGSVVVPDALSALTRRTVVDPAGLHEVHPAAPRSDLMTSAALAAGVRSLDHPPVPVARSATQLLWSWQALGDLRPPTSLKEEREQLRAALQVSRTEAFLKSLPSIGADFDAAATTDNRGITDWDDLPVDTQELYPTKLEYYQEATTTLMASPHIERALSQAGMCAVHNDGIANGGSNNCFLISLLQHATGDYLSSHADLVDQWRDILTSAPHLEYVANEKISADSKVARALVELINGDPSIQPKLNVEVISEQGGVVHRDRLGSSAPDARTVVIWDRGGHFEAVTGSADLY